MKQALSAIGLCALVALVGACSLESLPSRDSSNPARKSGPADGSSLGSDSDGTFPPPPDGPNGGSGGTCKQPTGIYEEERAVKATLEPPGPDTPCPHGTYVDSVDFSQPPPLGDLPGCSTTKDEWSPNGCTHTVERRCEEGSETCVETITFANDLSSYSGSRTCSGTFEGVDESGPYVCRTTIKAKLKP